MQENQVKIPQTIYVIMPFSQTTPERMEDYWTEHFNHFIVQKISQVIASDEILKQFDWTIKRSSVVQGGPLNYEIFWDLLSAQLVIADLTDLNANVLYELGIRHTFCSVLGFNRTVMIQDENVFKLPFDFTNYSVLKYNKTRVDSWKQDIRLRMNSCVANRNYKDNPVSMTLAQHSFSFRDFFAADVKPTKMQEFQHAIDGVKALKELGFSIEWVQKLIERSMPAPQQNDMLASLIASEFSKNFLANLEVKKAVASKEINESIKSSEASKQLEKVE
jgi:hypothetical protein